MLNFKKTSLAGKRRARFLLLAGACESYVSCVDCVDCAACVALDGNPALQYTCVKQQNTAYTVRRPRAHAPDQYQETRRQHF